MDKQFYFEKCSGIGTGFVFTFGDDKSKTLIKHFRTMETAREFFKRYTPEEIASFRNMTKQSLI